MKQNTIEKISNKNKANYLQELENRAYHKLIKHYSNPNYFYNVKMINNILNNEKTHYVEMFKEYLLYEDYNEFLWKYYGKALLYGKLKKILTFYEKYSKIFPNYTALRESKYIYKNIKKKQKIINQINENKKKEQEKENSMNYDDDNSYSNSSYIKTIFNTKVINSIYTGHNTLTINKNKDIINLTQDENQSIYNIINGISDCEKKMSNKITKFKILKNNTHLNNKKDEKINSKKISDLLINSFNLNINYNINNNSLNKNNLKIEFPKNIVQKNLSVNNNNNHHNNTNKNKIKLNPYNYKHKQKSFSNIYNQKQKFYGSIKYNNYFKKIINSNSINESSNNQLNKKDKISYAFNYENFRKNLLSTNSTNSPKIMTERFFSSPKKIKNIKYINKRCISNSKNKNVKDANNNLFQRKINSFNNGLRKKVISKSKNNISNINITNLLKKEKNLINNKFNKRKVINNYNPESIKKFYSNNISNLNIKNKNTRKNKTYYNSNNKNKIENNFNIINGIMNNSTQINIYTGSDLIKSLNLYMNSIIKNSSFYHGAKSFSKNDKKINNMKKFIHTRIKDKSNNEPYSERNSSNEKLLKLLNLYCKEGKHRKTNIKKNHFNLCKYNKSLNYKTKSKSKSKSNWDEKSFADFNKKFNNININQKRILKRNVK